MEHHTSDDAQFSPAIERALDDAVARELKAYGAAQQPPGPVPGAVVGVWIPGKGSYVRAVGSANLSPTQPMALDDKFRVGSNTKTFVITVLLQLVDERKLSLDDPVNKFDIGVKIPNGDHITVRQLCQMRSGLIDAYNAPQYDNLQLTPETKLTPRELIATAVANPPLFPPGTKWNYSNTNYLILGLIIEAVTHKTAAGEIERRLLVPLQLKNTTFPVTDPGCRFPSRTDSRSRKTNGMDVTVTLPPSVTWAAGVMISDMPDMKRWVKAYVTGSTNSTETQRERLACIPPVIGALGLGIGCSAKWCRLHRRNSRLQHGRLLPSGEGCDADRVRQLPNRKTRTGGRQFDRTQLRQILFPNNVAFPNAPATK